MSDLSRAAEMIGQDSPVFQEMKKVAKDLETIVGNNQNRGCGGDRKMSGAQWEGLKEILGCFKDYDIALKRLRHAADRPFMDDEPASFSDSDIPF